MIAPQASFGKKQARLVSTLPALRQISFHFFMYMSDQVSQSMARAEVSNSFSTKTCSAYMEKQTWNKLPTHTYFYNWPATCWVRNPSGICPKNLQLQWLQQDLAKLRGTIPLILPQKIWILPPACLRPGLPPWNVGSQTCIYEIWQLHKRIYGSLNVGIRKGRCVKAQLCKHTYM